MMRRLLVGAGAMVVALVAPAWGATSDVNIQNFSFQPGTITVAPGDAVTWHWTGTGSDLDHSVTADAGQAESFDSDPSNAFPAHQNGDTFSHTFNQAGTFTYHCKVHPYMHGNVVVRVPGTTPADTTPPVLSRLRVTAGRTCRGAGPRCHKRPTRISFRLSEAATVRLAFERSSDGRRRTFDRSGTAGANVVRLSTRRLPRGRWRLSLRATDAAGNRSPAAVRSVRVR